MIVRDEEQNIRRCLDSVKDSVDEMIIADTGSTDQTKAVCREYGAQVFDFPWKENFADARNFSLEKAQGDWILWLDADEAAEITDFPSFKASLNGEKDPMIRIPMMHFYGKDPPEERRTYLSSAVRLFRRESGIRFAGNIHEHLVSSVPGFPIPTKANRTIRILHYGYMESAWKRKDGRNLDLLRKEKLERPDSAWLYYHLAAEYHRSGKEADAFQSVNRSIIGFLRKNLLPPSLVYKLKYDILTASGNYETVNSGIEKAISLYPDYVDLRFYQGIAQIAMGEYEKAEQTFSCCLILGESNPDYLILKGTGSFLSLYCLGFCHEKRGKPEEAKEAFRQAEELDPGLDCTISSGLWNFIEKKS